MLKPINLKLDEVSIIDIETHKTLSNDELLKDLDNLRKLNVSKNGNNFYGNPFLYHHQLKNLLKCRRKDGKTIYDIFIDPEKRTALIENTKKRNRGGKTAAGNVFECFRINLGSIVMFKSTTAKYIYKKYGATDVLDPTAGWGGRMLGAWSLGINYTGIDTNIEMFQAYDKMINHLKSESNPLVDRDLKLSMIWGNCLDVDFSKIDYDFVLTSPPYINMEIYEHMKEWDTDESFYVSFFIPLWHKCITHIRDNGKVCFNISPKMYEDAVKFGLPICDIEEDLKQQLGQQSGKKKQDKIYIWKK